MPELEVILHRLRATNRRNRWVFETRRGTQLSDNHPTLRFREICDALDFEQHYVVHSLRKYWASTVAQQGMDTKMMIKMFGHTDFQVRVRQSTGSGVTRRRGCRLASRG